MKLVGERIYLRPMDAGDARVVLAYQERNQAFFAQFEPTMPDRSLNIAQIMAQLERGRHAQERGEAYPFGVFLLETDELVGRIALNFVTRGPRQSAMIGYTLDQAHNGQGYGSEAARLCVKFGFEHLDLHRIEAGIMPINIGSKRVVEKCGFTFEGIMRKSLLVEGRWEDLESWAILDEDWAARTGR
ncbi:GNAT family N-acetyltransferase [Tumebacillus permanentifrigoris]|nr:GNAT family protein [Tumebacillus permanentifrigoris]